MSLWMQIVIVSPVFLYAAFLVGRIFEARRYWR